MGSCHSVNRGQVNEVLAQVEATSTAIRGIEANAEQLHRCTNAMKAQREELTMAAEHAVRILDTLNERFNSKSDEVCDIFAGTFETLANLVEEIQISMNELGLQDVLHDLFREFGPLLVPAVVLLITVTVSNCFFGFLLAGDPRLAGAFSIGGQKGATAETQASGGKGLNILSLFAAFHVVLLGISILYLIIEGLRQTCCRRQSSRQQESLFDARVGSVSMLLPSRDRWRSRDSRQALLRQWGRLSLRPEVLLGPSRQLGEGARDDGAGVSAILVDTQDGPEAPRGSEESSESAESI